MCLGLCAHQSAMCAHQRVVFETCYKTDNSVIKQKIYLAYTRNGILGTFLIWQYLVIS